MIRVLLFALLLNATSAIHAQVGINSEGGLPHSSAGLDVDFNNRGFLPPRLSTIQRDAIAEPAEGLTLFNSDTKCLNIYTEGIWKQVCPDCNFPNPQPGNNGPVCSGSELLLFAFSIPGAVYSWSGPNGFTADVQNPILPEVTTENAGAYAVRATLNGCTSSPQITYVQVNPTPSVPEVGVIDPVCQGASIQLTSSIGPGLVNWWNGPAGFVSSAQNPVIPLASQANAGEYTVSALAVATGCSSGTSSISIEVLNPQVLTTSPGSRVGAGTVNLSATASAGVIQWFDAPTGGTLLHTGASFTTPVICSTTTYYAGAIQNGCLSASRTSVIATVSKVFQVDDACSLTNGLVSYWRMEGNSSDYVGNNNGTDLAMSYGASYGKVGQGAFFGGGSSRITVGESTPLNSSSFSIGMWVRTTSSSGIYQVLARRSANFYEGYGLYFVPNTGKLGIFFGFGAPSEITLNTDKVINDGNWHFLTLTVDSSILQAKIYCDNILEGTLSLPSPIFQSGSLSIGYDVPNASTVYSFVGSLDQVGYWNRVLSAQEISDLHNSGSGQTMQ